jgi:hypothetical protein
VYLLVPIIFILGNVLGLDEWHVPICYQNPLFSWENASTNSGMCWFSVVPLIENSVTEELLEKIMLAKTKHKKLWKFY